MRILVDGDACPDITYIKELAQNYLIEMIVYVDWAHEREDDYYQTIICDIGSDSVDNAILSEVRKDDLVITQDYGLASLVLVREGRVLHPSGKIIRQENIDNLLMQRYVGSINRKSHKHLKGPKKRTTKDRDNFLTQIEKMIIKERFETKKD